MDKRKLNWYRVYINCYIDGHSAGRHVFIQAESNQDAVKKTTSYYSHEKYTKVLKAEKSDYDPTKPDRLTNKTGLGAIYYKE